MLGLATVAAASMRAPAQADDFPARDITLILPFAAGGPTDVVARVLAQEMSTDLKVTVLVENVVGGGGVVGTRKLLSTKPDGYTIMLGNSGTHGVAPFVVKDLPYNPVTDFQPIGLAATGPTVLLVRSDLGVSNMADFIAMAKAKPHSLKCGTAGKASSSGMTLAVFNAMAGVDTIEVPYESSTQAANDLLGGHVDFVFDAPALSKTYQDSGQLKPLLLTGAERLPLLADVPTAAEAGLPDFGAIISWWAILAPKGTPENVVERLNQSIRSATASANYLQRTKDLGLQVPPEDKRSPQALTDWIQAQHENWAQIAKIAKVEPQ